MTYRPDVDIFIDAWRAALGSGDQTALDKFASVHATLLPNDVARLDHQWRSALRFAPIIPAKRRWVSARPAKQSETKVLDVSSSPVAALLGLHAPASDLRQMAVRVAPMQDQATLATLMLRCNDWSAPVQQAANARLTAILPSLDAATLAPLVLFLVNRGLQWQRGGADAVKRIMAHPVWLPAVKIAFMTTSTGPLAKSLRALLRDPVYDSLLPDFATGAKSAFVRAVAAETLWQGRARWFDRYDWVWHDKVFNLRRKIAKWDQREVTVSPQTAAATLRVACFDPSAKLRSLAADRLITTGPTAGDDLVRALLQDRAPSVRWRMAYYQKKWCQTHPNKET